MTSPFVEFIIFMEKKHVYCVLFDETITRGVLQALCPSLSVMMGEEEVCQWGRYRRRLSGERNVKDQGLKQKDYNQKASNLKRGNCIPWW